MLKKILIGLSAVVIGIIAVAIVLANEKTLVFHPKGVIAHQEFELIVTNILLMLVIILPTYLLLFWVVWKYCLKGKKTTYDPNHSVGPYGELLMWVLPSIIVAIMAIVTWDRTHKLDPYRPLESPIKPLAVQVVALDWKWLFIYPELGIATLNYLQFPEKTPVHFRLTADHSPMNSFWIPQLSGQIYSMAGMSTQLHLMADAPGEYTGREVEINGEGYSDMTFSVKSTSSRDFENWIAEVKKSPQKLTKDVYNELTKHAINKSIIFYSDVEKNLFQQIIHKYMYPAEPVL